VSPARAKANEKARPIRTGLEILAGAVPPVHVDVQVRLVSDDTAHHAAPAQLVALLEAHRPGIEAWLRRDADNPYLLLTDPIAALRKAGVKFTPEAAANLERTRRRGSAPEVLPPGLQLRGLTVAMGKRRGRDDGENGESVRAAAPAQARRRVRAE
jgi:hypothetical protein